VITLLFIALAAFFTSSLTASMGVGGGVVLLALMAQLVPPAVLIPLHGAAQMISNANNVVVQYKHINWAFVKPFTLGAIAGGLLLTPITLLISPWFGQLALGIFILIATWRSQWLKLHSLHPTLGGAITTSLSLVLGATGPLVISILPKRHWSPQTIVATRGLAMTIQHGIKIIVFASLNINILDYWPMLIAMGVASLAGNIAGAKLLGKLNEERFRYSLNLLMTALAIRLIWSGLHTAQNLTFFNQFTFFN
jgi:uncharacterized membrane protein YfcA